MENTQTISETLADAGCSQQEIHEICECYSRGDLKKAQKLIDDCRRKTLTELHDKQRCIDRIDYLTWQLARESE